MQTNLDLNDVALFVQVVRYGSFAVAARYQGLPANTVSRRIQQLEGQLGLRLLHRSTRKLTLTNAGQTLHDRCAAAVDGLAEAGQELLTGRREPSGLVRVGAPADFFDFFPMAWVVEFLDRHPAVRLDFVLSDATADLIAERIDVALRGGPLQDSGYVGREVIGPVNHGLVASPGYIRRRGAPRTLQELAQHDCVGFSQPSGRATWRLTGPGGVPEEVEVTSRFLGNTAQVLRKAALEGLGIALLPPTLTRYDLQGGRLVTVLPEYQRTGHALHVLYPSRRHLPGAVSAFIEMVIEKMIAAESLEALV